MSETVLVTGGTGTLGKPLVRRLAEAGHTVRLLSRHARPLGSAGAAVPKSVEWCVGDLVEGSGLDAALEEVTTVVHAASDPRRPGNDITAGRRLVEAAKRAGVGHLVFVSIVGVDRVPLGYYRNKLAVEGLVAASPVPWSILRATQFHDLMKTIIGGAAKVPLMPVPSGVSFQPVEVTEVAERLVQLVDAGPSRRAPDFGGPEVRSVVDLAEAYLRAAGLNRRILPVPVPGRTFAGFREGGHLTPDHADGRRTWEEYLAEQVSGR